MTTTSEALRDSLAKPEKVPRSVWDITGELEALDELIAAAGGEITPEVEAMLATLEGDLTAKVERIALFARDSELDADKAGAEKDRYAERETTYRNRERRLRALLLTVLEHHGRDKMQTHRATVVRVRGQVTYRWAGDTYEAIPDGFRRQKPPVYSLDVDAVKRALAEGKPIPPEVVSGQSFHVRIS